MTKMEIVNRLQNADSIEEIEILREGFNSISTVYMETSNESNNYNNQSLQVDTEKLQLLYQYPKLLERDDVVTHSQRDMYIKVLENYSQGFSGNQNGNQMEMPKVLTLSNGHSIYNDERKAGY